MLSADAVSEGWDAPKGRTEACACAITALEVLVVQPVYLPAEEHTNASQEAFEDQSREVSHDHTHRLQVKLEAQLISMAGLPQYSEEATVEHEHECSWYPIPIQQVTLDLLVLSRQSQVIVHEEYSLLQLLMLQQDAQTQPLQQPAVPTQGLHSIGQHSSDGNNWSVTVELCITIPCQPCVQTLDFLNLRIMTKSPLYTYQRQQHQQQQQQHQQQAAQLEPPKLHLYSAESVSEYALDQQVHLVADVPLLLLPAVAHQEVQQLLLPAMGQEAQTEAAGHSLQVEHVVWKHMQQLVHDLYAVALLVRSLEDPASEAVASSIAAEAAAAANEAGASAGRLRLPTIAEELPASATIAASAPCPEAAALATEEALDSIADGMIFPVLLPFLAAYGLRTLLQLLLLSLPEKLQQRWEQQQHHWLPSIQAAAAEQEAEVSGSIEACTQSVIVAGSAQAQTAAGASTAADCGDRDLQGSRQQGTAATAAVGDSGADVQKLKQEQAHFDISALRQSPQASITSAEQRQHHTLQEQQAEQETGVEYDIDSKPGAAGGTSVPVSRVGQQVTPGGIAVAAWYSPLTQFDSEQERRYLTWKHLSLFHLDQFQALFGLLYLMALLIRTVSEPTVLFHVVYVLLKVVPHVPLMLGYKRHFLRYREQWFWSIILVTVVGFLIFTSVQNFADPVTLLPQQSLSAFWKGRGELAVNAMIPFIQHMRLRPYIVYILTDAAMMTWVFAQFHGWWEAVGRWGLASIMSIGLCWGFDLHMRRKFAAVEQRLRA